MNHRHMIRALLLTLLLAAGVSPAWMQSTEPQADETLGSVIVCDFDAAALIATLEAAQTRYTSGGVGDKAEAVGMLRDAQTQLTALINTCDPHPTLTGEYTTEDQTYNFRFPETWIVDVSYSNTLGGRLNFIQMANTQSALEGSGFAVPNMVSGDRVVGVILGNAGAITSSVGVFDLQNYTPMEIIRLYERTLTSGEGYTFDEAEAITINDEPAARLLFGGESFEGVIYAVPIMQGEMTHYALLIALGAVDELALLEPTVAAIASQITVVAR